MQMVGTARLKLRRAQPRFFTAEIACLRADPHRQAESAESDAIGPSFIEAGEKAFQFVSPGARDRSLPRGILLPQDPKIPLDAPVRR
jgi:hypothetical protein